MKKKPRKPAKPTKRGAHVLSDAMRADDERLREKLRTADLGKLDDVIGKAIRPAP